MTKYLLLNRITSPSGIDIKAGKEYSAENDDLASIIASGGVLALQPVPFVVGSRVRAVQIQEARGRQLAELDVLTSAQAEAAAGASEIEVAEEGGLLGSFTRLNITGAGATASDAGGGVARIDIPASSGGVPTTRLLTAADGLTGGGDLSADRTFSVGAPPDGSIQVNADSVQVGTLATDAQHGNRGGGAAHAVVVAAGAAGFMTGADKTKLDGIAAGATATTLSNATPGAEVPGAGSAGVAVDASRSDHVHPVATAAPVSADKSANAEGAAVTFARSDHKHDVTTAAPANVGVANAEGAATTLARSDHVHNLPFAPVQTALAAASADVSVNNVKITNLATPAAATDAATKGYADGLVGVSDYKTSARAATTANVVLATGGLLTIDGVALASGDRVLVRAQTAPAENGVYAAAVGAWARTTDADSSSEVTAGLSVYVAEGTVNGLTYWTLTTADPIVLNTTALTFDVRGFLATASPANVDKSAAAVGTSLRAARSDHKHDVSTAAPVTISTANAEGTATTIARSDHVHAHGSQAGGANHADVIAAGASGFMTGADKTKLDGITITGGPAGSNGDIQLKSGTALSAFAPSNGTFAAGVGGAWVAGNTADFFAVTGTNPAASAGLRFANAANPLIAVRNNGNTNDLVALQVVGTNGLDVGTADAGATAAKQFNQIRVYGTAFTDLGVASTLYLRCAATLVQMNEPVVGCSATSSPFSVHGRAVQAMADANQVLANTIYSRSHQRFTGAHTADRTATWPHPSAEDRSYFKVTENDCTGSFSTVMSTGTGSTYKVPNSNKQLVQYTPDGVEAIAPGYPIMTLENAAIVPPTPAAGSTVYVAAGALKAVGSGGTTTTLAVA